MLRRLLRWGAVLELPECKRLIGILDEMEFKQSKPRTVILTYDHAVAIIARANETGRPSIALAQALQFETALRQRDVIGEWEPGEEKPSSGIMLTSPNGRRNRRWANGLTWSHIGSDGVLRKTTTKTAAAIEVPVSLCPLVEQEIAQTPIERRVGPMIVNERTGLPYTQNTFRTVWREIAEAAGIPKSVWNMDSRAGSITEATDAGADLEKARHHAGHRNASMTARYSRKTLEKTAEVARLRMEHRRKKKGP